jgi:protein-S-isoprenylcysteine O-methyltransferase Ste14
MAKKLNQTRIRDTATLVSSCFIAILFSKQLFTHAEFGAHELMEFAGYLLVSAAAIGRVYCTAFLGGFKNRNVIDYGPFSICRNPLYLFSFIGVCGISLMSVNLFAIFAMPLGFLAIYIPLIKREEEYLIKTFGKEYLSYMKKTPRLFPNLKLYHAPATVEMTPRTLLNALKDSVMWFLAFPLLEFVEWLQDAGYLKPMFYLSF